MSPAKNHSSEEPMPNTKKATKEQVESFARANKLTIPINEALALVENAELDYVESCFKDPGEDYTKLVHGGKTIAFMAGY